MDPFRRKAIGELIARSEVDSGGHLKRALDAASLTLLGVGAIIGAGIFVLLGPAAAQNAGPAVVLAFLLTGATAILAGLCYAEFASVLPVAGSAYTYATVTLGEVIAWIIGWDLILEYGLGATTVAIGWSGYVVYLLHDLGIDVPCSLTGAYGTVVDCAGGGRVTATFNLPACLIVIAAMLLNIRGAKESAMVNSAAVFVKLAVILLFVLAAAKAVVPTHWHPFIPPSEGPTRYGWDGIVSAAGLLFFAYIGFDAVSTTAQEARNPQRDMPVAIIGSVLICTMIYILVAGIATGVVPYRELNIPNPIVVVADRAGLGWMAVLINFGAIAGLSSVILVLLLAQSRVVYSLGRDGLLPSIVYRTHDRFRTPHISLLVLGLPVAIAAAVVPLHDAATLVSIGTLFAFFVVSIGLMFLRYQQPDLPRPFRTPLIFVVAPLSAAATLYLMVGLGLRPWLRLSAWGAIGLGIYICYGARHSILAQVNRGRR